MRLHDILSEDVLEEAVNAPDQEVYHWTSAPMLRAIFKRDVVRGETSHEVNGKNIRGVSLSRNPFFDIQDTYQVAGVKAWRLGFNLQRLRYDHRVMPVRDDRYAHIPRSQRTREPEYHGFTPRPVGYHMASSDENEEFVVGDIYPVWHYLTSLAVEDRHINLTLHPNEMDDDEEGTARTTVMKSDQHLLYDILAGTVFGQATFPKWSATGKWRRSAIRLPTTVKLLVIDRTTHRVHDFRQFYAAFNVPAARSEDDMEEINLWTDERGKRGASFNQTKRKYEL